MYVININYVQYFSFVPIENIKYSNEKWKIQLASEGFVSCSLGWQCKKKDAAMKQHPYKRMNGLTESTDFSWYL